MLLITPVTAVWTQSSKPTETRRPQFEVADIHPSPYGFGGRFFTVAPLTGDRFVVHQATPLNLITWAYGVPDDAVTGGPPGLEFDHYEIVAMIPPGTTQEDARLMLQRLLAARFNLAEESGVKPLPALLLKTGKGPVKLKPTANPASDGGCRYRPPDPPPPPGTPPPSPITLNCFNTTMEHFAQQIQGMADLRHPVVDATDRKGGWDFDFSYDWRSGQGAAVTDALDRLGLMLEAGTAPRQAMVIVNMAEAPTPNVAGIERLLPPLSTPVFDVAVIRPSQQESKDMQILLPSADQVKFTGGTLLGMIGWAWKTSTTTILGAPAFVDKQGWDITAKIALPLAGPTPGRQAAIDLDEVRLMLRSLLVDRFGLKIHNENRLADAYTLFAAGSKLKPVYSSNRSSCDGRLAPGEKDPRAANPSLTKYIHCQNVTIDQFVQELQRYALDIMKNPLRNATEIVGRYDISLSWSDARTLASSPPPGDSTGVVTGDPTGVPISLPDAMLKQLGLKLQLQKRPVPALVVDHLEERPTAN